MANRLSSAQVKQLLAPIKPIRVLRDGKGMSHVSQQDVVAHLIRVFGFANFETELLSCECIYQEPRKPPRPEGAEPETPFGGWFEPDHKTRWDVAYRATMRLTVKNPDGSFLTRYEDASVGEAQNLVRHEAHDLAMKSAISLAKKRCCIHLGDQFGLSLYNKGQMTALVRGTLVMPEGPEPTGDDVQEGVEQQVSMGTDEVEKHPEPTEEQEQAIRETLGGEVIEAAK